MLRAMAMADPVSGQEAARAPASFNVVPLTPPVEATLRILMNSVAFLMGAAVVRQPPGTDGVVASVGRMPWLHDRRLTTLELPEDTLPSNRAVALDWPVPFQAEWVGAPPRLLIARLVFQGRTVGVLLGTLITRDPLTQQTREALDLSCELIASSVAGEAAMFMAAAGPKPIEPGAGTAAEDKPSLFVPAAEPQVRHAPLESDVVVDDVRKGVAAAGDARSLGRVLRDAMSKITDASAFSIALFHAGRPEVAYRYKVVGPDRDSAELGRQHVDDGPASYAARHDRRWHVFTREVAIRDELDVRVREVVVLQLPLVSGGDVFGLVTVQTFRAEGFSDSELRLVATVIEAAAPSFAQVRATGRFQPPTGAAPVTLPTAAPAPATPTPAPTAPPTAARSAEDVLRELLRRCGGAGFTTAFLMGVDPGAGALRGELVADGDAAREVDYALGISSGKFSVPLDDRYNAMARAVREARIVPAPTAFEITRPATDFEGAQALEKLAGGGRSVTLPLIVNGEAAGALVLGPMRDEPSFFAIEAIRGYVQDAVKELTELWSKPTA
jgi:hypothetical protein